MKKCITAGFVLAAITGITACGGGKNKEAEAPANNQPAAKAKPAAAPDNSSTAKGTVSFKVNGVEANTAPGGSNDNAAHIALFTAVNKYLSISLNGDDPRFPHRGYITIAVEKFNGQTGELKCTGSFSRYQTANAGGEIMYNSAAPGNFKLNITAIEKVPDPPGSDMYLLSGSFSGTMGLATGFKNEVTTIEITNGSFSGIRMAGYKP